MRLRTHAPLLLLLAAASSADAQSNKIQAQYWIDLSTTSMSIPGMPEDGMAAGGGGGGLMGSLIGAAVGNQMKDAMGVGRSKTMSTELWVRARPSGVEGTHAIPAGMNMGQALPLVPIRPVQVGGGTPTERSESTGETPKGRILLYWGCGDEVRKGQPKVLDFASKNYGEFAQFFASHGRQSKGVSGKPGDSVWPNEKDSKPVPDNASLAGGHAVAGDGVPDSLKFNVDPSNDFLPKVKLSAAGALQDSIALSWNTMDNARGYFLQAQAGGRDGAKEGTELVLWSSSEQPDNGWSLMNYQSPAQVASLIKQKVVLAPTVSTCKIPKGIFGKAEGAMVNMIAYGPELNVSYPARPQKAPADWQPDWTARVRVKSTGMTMLGMDDSSRGGRGRGNSGDERQERPQQQEQKKPEINPVNILKGLFGN